MTPAERIIYRETVHSLIAAGISRVTAVRAAAEKILSLEKRRASRVHGVSREGGKLSQMGAPHRGKCRVPGKL